MPSSARRTFFHCHPADRDPATLLDPDRQVTEPWGGPDHGRCDKCGGGGAVVFECFSCVEAGAGPDRPACQGRVRFSGTCPACKGSGEINQTRRHGVAVFPTREGLYRYIALKDAEVEEKIVVEVEGPLSDDLDLDADQGALLIHPRRLVAVEPLDAAVVRAIRAREAGQPSAGAELPSDG